MGVDLNTSATYSKGDAKGVYALVSNKVNAIRGGTLNTMAFTQEDRTIINGDIENT